MKTVKTSRFFVGTPISISALCRLEDRPLPYSLLDVVATDGFRRFGRQTSTGDVECDWEMKVWQNGFWSAKGEFYDDGTVTGDFFFLELMLDRDRAVGARLEGSILNIFESRHLTVSKEGSDRWIRENWHAFETSGPSVRLHAAPAIGQLVGEIVFVLAVAVGAAFEVDSRTHRRGFAKRTGTDMPNPNGDQPGIEFGEADDDLDP